MAVDMEKILSDTFWRLSCERSVKSIKLADVLIASGVSRQTFYNHFRNMRDLIIYTIIERFTAYPPTVPNINEYYDSAVFFYKSITEHKDFMMQVYKLDDKGTLPAAMTNYYFEWFKRTVPETYSSIWLPELLFSMKYDTHALNQLNREWILGGMKESPEYVSGICTDALPPLLRDYIENPTSFA